MFKLLVVAAVIMALVHDGYSEDPPPEGGVTVPAAGGEMKGKFSTCAHGVMGEVMIMNTHQLKIMGFNYDGTGPAAHFHAMKKPATAIHKELEKHAEYVTLAYPPGVCKKLAKIADDITLTFPEPIANFLTVGPYCYQKCVNFGHYNVPTDIGTPAAVPDTVNITSALCVDIDETEDAAAKEAKSLTCTTTANSKFTECDPAKEGEGGAGQIISSFWIMVPVLALAFQPMMKLFNLAK